MRLGRDVQGLSLDWRLGCELFECLLADAETPLNAGNWAYNSGACGCAMPGWLVGWHAAASTSMGMQHAARARRSPCTSAPARAPLPPHCARRGSAGVGTDPRDRGFKVVSQGLRYDPDARLVTAWLPELADLQHVQPGGGPELAHQPWLASPQALAAAGLRLGQRPPVAAAEAAAGGESAAEERRSWYPEPLVDPALQTAKGPKRPPQRQ